MSWLARLRSSEQLAEFVLKVLGDRANGRVAVASNASWARALVTKHAEAIVWDECDAEKCEFAAVVTDECTMSVSAAAMHGVDGGVVVIIGGGAAASSARALGAGLMNIGQATIRRHVVTWGTITRFSGTGS